MFGLLDQFNTDDPAKQARLAQSLALLQAGGPSRVPVSLFQGLGMAGQAGLEAKRQAQKDAQAKLMQDMQLQQLTMQRDEAKRRLEQSEQIGQLAQSSVTPGNPAEGQVSPQHWAGTGNAWTPEAGKFDRQKFLQGMLGMGGDYTMKAAEALQKTDEKPIAVGAEQGLWDNVNKRWLVQPTAKPEKQPSDVQAYEYAKEQGYKGSFLDFQLAQKRAGASSITNYGSPIAAVGPDGKPAFIQPSRTGGAPAVIPGYAPPPAAGAEPTEGERKAATLLQRLRFSQGQIADTLGENPSADMPQLMTELVRKVTETGANAMTPAARQKVESAQLDILDAALTLGTGAAYTREQLEGYRKSYFPQVGDKPANIEAKMARLQNVIQAAEVAAGRAGAKLPKVATSNVQDLVNKYRSKP